MESSLRTTNTVTIVYDMLTREHKVTRIDAPPGYIATATRGCIERELVIGSVVTSKDTINFKPAEERELIQ